jgi:hypothetical protein
MKRDLMTKERKGGSDKERQRVCVGQQMSGASSVMGLDI